MQMFWNLTGVAEMRVGTIPASTRCARNLSERKHHEAVRCLWGDWREPPSGLGRVHEPVRPGSACGRRRPAWRGRRSGHRWCCGRWTWRRHRRSGRRRDGCSDRRCNNTATAATTRRVWLRPGVRLPAAARSERLWVPTRTTARISSELLRIGQNQLGGLLVPEPVRFASRLGRGGGATRPD